MDGIVWAALIVAAALVYLANAIAKRPAPQIVHQPSAATPSQPPESAPLNVLPSTNHSETAYILAFDYKDEQVRILCVPGLASGGRPIWSYQRWVGGYFTQAGIADQTMVMKKSDAEIEVAEREAIRAEEQRRISMTGGGGY